MDVPLSTNLIKKVADQLNEVELEDIPDDFETTLDELIKNAKAISEKIKLKATSTECVVPPVTVQAYVSPCDVQTEPSAENRCRRISVRVKRINLEKRFGPPPKRCVVSLKRLDMQRYLQIYESNRPVATCATTTALSTNESQNDVMVSLSNNEIDTENGSNPMRQRYTYNDYADTFNTGCSLQ